MLPISTNSGITVSSTKVSVAQVSVNSVDTAADQEFSSVFPVRPATIIANATGNLSAIRISKSTNPKIPTSTELMHRRPVGRNRRPGNPNRSHIGQQVHAARRLR